jgi:hypothetical protein
MFGRKITKIVEVEQEREDAFDKLCEQEKFGPVINLENFIVKLWGESGHTIGDDSELGHLAANKDLYYDLDPPSDHEF